MAGSGVQPVLCGGVSAVQHGKQRIGANVYAERQTARLSGVAGEHGAVGRVGRGLIVMPMIILAFANGFPGPAEGLPSSNGYLVLFIAIGVITFLGCILQYYFTRERVTEESITSLAETEKVKGPTLGKQAKAIFGDRFFVTAIIFYLLFQLSGGIKNGSMMSFTNNIKFAGLEPAFAMSILGIVGAVPMAAAILFVSPLCNKFGKKAVVLTGVSIQIYDTTDPVASPNAPNTPLMMPVASGTDAIMIELYTDIVKAYCEKKGLDFAAEEAKYQEKRRRKAKK